VTAHQLVLTSNASPGSVTAHQLVLWLPSHFANCFAPTGYCDTDMTSHKGPKPAYDGARIFTWLATKPPQEFESGEFWVFDGSGVKHEM